MARNFLFYATYTHMDPLWNFTDQELFDRCLNLVLLNYEFRSEDYHSKKKDRRYRVLDA